MDEPLDPASELSRLNSDPRAEVEIDSDRGLVRRYPGIRFDSGGLGKGLAADLVAEGLGEVAYCSIDCGGDLRAGGDPFRELKVSVGGPWSDDGIVTELMVPAGHAVATSGITRRAWNGPMAVRAIT